MANVGGERNVADACGSHLCDDLGRDRLGGMQCDVGAGFSHGYRDGGSHAARGAGNECILASEAEGVEDHGIVLRSFERWMRGELGTIDRVRGPRA
jgi:hypothetical protein